MTVFLGISQDHLEKIAEAIKEVLSDTVLLALKTKGFHWNVTGSDFWQLHEMFDKQHAELSEGVVQRIRLHITALEATKNYETIDMLTERLLHMVSLPGRSATI